MAARFVSGYQEGDRNVSSQKLHAWVEVYLPGGGWRGYDPTLGLLVSDRHILLATSAIPEYNILSLSWGWSFLFNMVKM